MAHYIGLPAEFRPVNLLYTGDLVDVCIVAHHRNIRKIRSCFRVGICRVGLGESSDITIGDILERLRVGFACSSKKFWYYKKELPGSVIDRKAVVNTVKRVVIFEQLVVASFRFVTTTTIFFRVVQQRRSERV